MEITKIKEITLFHVTMIKNLPIFSILTHYVPINTLKFGLSPKYYKYQSENCVSELHQRYNTELEHVAMRTSVFFISSSIYRHTYPHAFPLFRLIKMDFRIFFASSTILWQCKTISLFKLVRPKLELEGGILGVENVWARDSQDHHNCGHLDFASEKGISYFQLLTEPVPLKNYFSANFSLS